MTLVRCKLPGRWWVWLCVPAFVALAGCGGTSASAQPEGEQRIQQLATMYVRYGAGPKTRGKSPPNEKALKEFIQQLPPKELQAMKIENVDDLFHSPRDREPYVINYGLKAMGGGPPMGPKGPPSAEGPPATPSVQVLCYEKVGVGGKRYVAYATGQVEEVDGARARALGLK